MSLRRSRLQIAHCFERPLGGTSCGRRAETSISLGRLFELLLVDVHWSEDGSDTGTDRFQYAECNLRQLEMYLFTAQNQSGEWIQPEQFYVHSGADNNPQFRSDDV